MSHTQRPQLMESKDFQLQKKTKSGSGSLLFHHPPDLSKKSAAIWSDIEKPTVGLDSVPADQAIPCLINELERKGISLLDDKLSCIFLYIPCTWLFHAALIGLKECQKQKGHETEKSLAISSADAKASQSDVASVVARATSGKIGTGGLTSSSILELQESFNQVEKALLGGHEHARRMELALRTWRTEKMQLKSTIEEIKYQLQYYQSKVKSGGGRHAEEVKTKKKLVELSKQMFKMKLETLRAVYNGHQKKIEDFIKELKEFQSHTGPKMCIQACLAEWEKANDDLNNLYFVLKRELEVALSAKELPDVTIYLSKQLIIDFPEEPNFVKLWEESQRESSLSSNPHSAHKSSSRVTVSRPDATSPSVSSKQTRLNQITDQIMLVLTHCDRSAILEEVESYRASKGTSEFERLDPDDIIGEIVLRLTTVG